MTYSNAAPLNDIASFVGPRSPQGLAGRPIVRTAFVSLATVVGALAISGSHVSDPTLHETAEIARKMIANSYGNLPVGVYKFDSARDLAGSGRQNGDGSGRTFASSRAGRDTPAPTAIALAVILSDPYGALPREVRTFESLPVFTDSASAPRLVLDRPPSQLSNVASELVSDITSELADVSQMLPVTGQGIGVEHRNVKPLAQGPTPPPRGRNWQALRRAAAPPPASQPTERPTETASATPVPDNRNFFEKLFGIPQRPSGTVLAYAQPEDSSIGTLRQSDKSITLPLSDRHTAIYDISARTVYMPNGDRLEAHSGYGALLDDPNHVDEKDLGATPPHAYELALRHDMFHGVQALRLNPVGSGDMYGRTGLLVHPFMLGPNGDSNGCVSIKDYSKFLQAFLHGEVTRLVVVSQLGPSG